MQPSHLSCPFNHPSHDSACKRARDKFWGKRAGDKRLAQKYKWPIDLKVPFNRSFANTQPWLTAALLCDDNRTHTQQGIWRILARMQVSASNAVASSKDLLNEELSSVSPKYFWMLKKTVTQATSEITDITLTDEMWFRTAQILSQILFRFPQLQLHSVFCKNEACQQASCIRSNIIVGCRCGNSLGT